MSSVISNELAEILQQEKSLPGQDDKAVSGFVASLNNLAAKCIKLCEYDTALTVLEKLDVFTKSGSPTFTSSADKVRAHHRCTMLNNFGCLEQKRGNYKAAYNYLYTALSLGSTSPQTYLNILAVLDKLGRIEAAINYAKLALSSLEEQKKLANVDNDSKSLTDINNMIILSRFHLGRALERKLLLSQQQQPPITSPLMGEFSPEKLKHTTSTEKSTEALLQEAIMEYNKAFELSIQQLGVSHSTTTAIYGRLQALMKYKTQQQEEGEHSPFKQTQQYVMNTSGTSDATRTPQRQSFREEITTIPIKSPLISPHHIAETVTSPCSANSFPPPTAPGSNTQYFSSPNSNSAQPARHMMSSAISTAAEMADDSSVSVDSLLEVGIPTHHDDEDDDEVHIEEENDPTTTVDHQPLNYLAMGHSEDVAQQDLVNESECNHPGNEDGSESADGEAVMGEIDQTQTTTNTCTMVTSSSTASVITTTDVDEQQHNSGVNQTPHKYNSQQPHCNGEDELPPTTTTAYQHHQQCSHPLPHPSHMLSPNKLKTSPRGSRVSPKGSINVGALRLTPPLHHATSSPPQVRHSPQHRTLSPRSPNGQQQQQQQQHQASPRHRQHTSPHRSPHQHIQSPIQANASITAHITSPSGESPSRERVRSRRNSSSKTEHQERTNIVVESGATNSPSAVVHPAQHNLQLQLNANIQIHQTDIMEGGVMSSPVATLHNEQLQSGECGSPIVVLKYSSPVGLKQRKSGKHSVTSPTHQEGALSPQHHQNSTPTTHTNVQHQPHLSKRIPQSPKTASNPPTPSSTVAVAQGEAGSSNSIGSARCGIGMGEPLTVLPSTNRTYHTNSGRASPMFSPKQPSPIRATASTRDTPTTFRSASPPLSNAVAAEDEFNGTDTNPSGNRVLPTTTKTPPCTPLLPQQPQHLCYADQQQQQQQQQNTTYAHHRNTLGEQEQSGVSHHQAFPSPTGMSSGNDQTSPAGYIHKSTGQRSKGGYPNRRCTLQQQEDVEAEVLELMFDNVTGAKMLRKSPKKILPSPDMNTAQPQTQAKKKYKKGHSHSRGRTPPNTRTTPPTAGGGRHSMQSQQHKKQKKSNTNYIVPIQGPHAAPSERSSATFPTNFNDDNMWGSSGSSSEGRSCWSSIGDEQSPMSVLPWWKWSAEEVATLQAGADVDVDGLRAMLEDLYNDAGTPKIVQDPSLDGNGESVGTGGHTTCESNNWMLEDEDVELQNITNYYIDSSNRVLSGDMGRKQKEKEVSQALEKSLTSLSAENSQLRRQLLCVRQLLKITANGTPKQQRGRRKNSKHNTHNKENIHANPLRTSKNHSNLGETVVVSNNPIDDAPTLTSPPTRNSQDNVHQSFSKSHIVQQVQRSHMSTRHISPQRQHNQTVPAVSNITQIAEEDCNRGFTPSCSSTTTATGINTELIATSQQDTRDFSPSPQVPSYLWGFPPNNINVMSPISDNTRGIATTTPTAATPAKRTPSRSPPARRANPKTPFSPELSPQRGSRYDSTSVATEGTRQFPQQPLIRVQHDDRNTRPPVIEHKLLAHDSALIDNCLALNADIHDETGIAKPVTVVGGPCHMVQSRHSRPRQQDPILTVPSPPKTVADLRRKTPVPPQQEQEGGPGGPRRSTNPTHLHTDYHTHQIQPPNSAKQGTPRRTASPVMAIPSPKPTTTTTTTTQRRTHSNGKLNNNSRCSSGITTAANRQTSTTGGTNSRAQSPSLTLPAAKMRRSKSFDSCTSATATATRLTKTTAHTAILTQKRRSNSITSTNLHGHRATTPKMATTTTLTTAATIHQPTKQQLEHLPPPKMHSQRGSSSEMQQQQSTERSGSVTRNTPTPTHQKRRGSSQPCSTLPAHHATSSFSGKSQRHSHIPVSHSPSPAAYNTSSAPLAHVSATASLRSTAPRLADPAQWASGFTQTPRMLQRDWE